LTLDDEGLDSSFSMKPTEFKAMVESVRNAEKSLGDIVYGPTQDEATSTLFRRSLYVIQDIKAGESITRDNVQSRRPDLGIHPRHLLRVLGKKASEDIKSGTPLTWDFVH
jgi:N-acetylneuraminate synthase